MKHAQLVRHAIAGEADAAAGSARLDVLEAENAALRQELEQTRRILRSATEYAIFALDAEGRITSWNAGASNLLGYAEDEIRGRSADILFVPEDREDHAFTAELCRALDRGRAVNERWHQRKDGTRFWASGVMLPLLDDQAQPAGFLNIQRDGSPIHAEFERSALLQAELTHRMKNTLSVALAVAVQSLRHAATPQEFQAAFGSRLKALARSQEMLARADWDGAPLAQIVARALAPYDGPPGRVAIDGIPVRLVAGAVTTLGLAFHELATNAAKYGALSVPGGRVAVTWSLEQQADGSRPVRIIWQERDGPPVSPPARRGFGSRLLEQSLRHEFGCQVQLDFKPEGLECRICLPSKAISAG